MAREGSRSSLILASALLLFGLLLGVASAISAYDEVRLSDVSVLLPFSSKASHTLESFNGCFDWKASNPTVVHLEVLDDCGKKVRVRAQGGDTLRPSRSWLFATDRATGRVLKCELFLDRISKIEVLTTTRTMHKDDIERLEIQAFDKAGNKFSTVEGLFFEWAIQQTTKTQSATSILQIVPFKDSGIEASDLLKSIEDQGKQSSAVLVRGVQTGKVVLTARLLDSAGAVDNVQLENKVEISVIESLVLDPSQDVYVTRKQYVQFVLQTFKRNGFQAVAMPNDKFIWTSSNTSVATVTPSGLVTSLAFGSTNITCAFVDMPENNAQVNLFVVQPAYLGLEVSEIYSGNQSAIVKGVNVHNWWLVHQQNYQVKVAVFDSESHRFFTTDGLDFGIDFSVQHVGVLEGQMAKNHASYNATMLKLGEFELEFKLNADGNDIKVRSPVTVVPPVKIEPSRQVVLPLDPFVKHQFTLKSSGGSPSQNHLWTSSNLSRVVVSSVGVIIGETEGVANIRCQDGSNPNNYDTIAASVAVPKSINFIPSPLEVALNGTLLLSVRLMDEHGTPFDNCSALPLDWQIADDSIVTVVDDSVAASKAVLASGACGVRILRGLKEGSVMVTVRYNHLSTSTLVSVFQELQLSQSIAVVTLGSSVTIGLSGGPGPWAGDPSKAVESVVAMANPDFVSIQPHRGPAGSGNSAWRYYTITCKALGRQTIRVRVGNDATASNTMPIVSERSIDYICSTPASLYIHPSSTLPVPEDVHLDCAEAMNKLVSTSEKGSVSRLRREFLLRNHRDVVFELAVFDADGNRYHNFSSLDVQWSTSTPSLLKLSNVENAGLDSLAVRLHSDKRLAAIPEAMGIAKIKVVIGGYIASVLEKSQAVAKDRVVAWKTIDYEFSFNLYNQLRVEPLRASVYLHPANSINLRAVSGSGFISHQMNSSEIARVVHSQDSSNQIHVSPLSEGALAVVVSDRCLPSDSVTATIFVSDVHAIAIRARDLVEVNTAINLTVQALDFYGNVFPEDQYGFLNLSARDDGSGILRVLPKDTKATSFLVNGVNIGYSTVTVTALLKARSQSISSEPHGIHVYPRFQLNPAQLVLVPGATFKLQWTGMVPQRAQVGFALTNASTAVRLDSSSGQIDALNLGHVQVAATASAHHSTEAAPFVVGRDTADIIVRYLEGIRIFSASNRMQVGSEQVLTVYGSANEPPFAWGNMDVKFEWTVGNSRVTQLAPIYTNVSLEEESAFAVRIHALSAGRSEIRVRIISAPASSRLQGLTCTYTIDVTEPLRLLSPSELLIAPNSRFQIRTNYDNDPQHAPHYELLRDFNDEIPSSSLNEIVRVTSKGEVVASNIAGSAFVLVSDSAAGFSSLSQSIVVKVVVKPVSHLSLSPQFSAMQISVGTQHRLAVQMRDERGQLFHAFDAIALKHMLNVDMVVGVAIIRANNNASSADVVLSGLGPGKAILQVQSTPDGTSSKVELSTYLPIEVTNAIEPAELLLHVGGFGHFTTRFGRDSGLHKRPWSSSDANVVAIDPETGKLRASSVGSATVFHNSSVHTRARVNVVKLDAVDALEPSLKFADSKTFTISVPLKFSAKGVELTDSLNAQHNVPVKCSSGDLPSYVTVDAVPASAGSRAKCSVTVSLANSSSVALKGVLSTVKSIALAVSAGEGDLIVKTVNVDVAPLFVTPADEIKLGGADVDSSSQLVKIEWKTSSTLRKTPLVIENSRPAQLEVHAVPELSTATADYFHVGLRASASATSSFSAVEVKFVNQETGQQGVIAVSYDKQALVAARAAQEIEAARNASASSFSFSSSIIAAFVVVVVLALVILVVALWRANTAISSNPPEKKSESSAPPPTPAPVNPFASSNIATNVPASAVKPTPNIFKGKSYGSPPTTSASTVFSPMGIGMMSPGAITSPYRGAKKLDNPFQ